MSEINKTFRIRTDIGDKLHNDYITLDANLVQDYDTFDILSVKINSVDTYKLHNANYGVVVGRVLANNGFGIPNAKLSIFIPADSEDGQKLKELYPFSNTVSKNRKGIRYNLLPNEKTSDCHQVVGTFPNKRYALDNDVVLEVFEKYYKYTTRSNNSGDYLIMGIPVGAHTLHMDLDLSDCGILSQRPRDFVYKGYTIEQFENPNMFKNGTEYSNLSQVFTQDQVVNVQPFWGNSTLGEKIGITRADINVAFKFEPTCVFIGSVISDNSSQGISKKCIPTENMGNMEELVTGNGTIEMIRKTPGGSIEEFQIKGTQLIDGNGTWCYQIPMNLDYMMTDEYGNMVPTDNPEKGIPTRTTVRFRMSMIDNEENVDNYFRAKVLVPHNPQNLDNGKHESYDYEFGSYTRDESFRDLFWNNVYSVKSYIPRFQKRKVGGWKEKKFTGIKSCNFFGSNNPIPYNNIRIKLPFMFTVMCALIKAFILITGLFNNIIAMLGNALADIGNTFINIGFGKIYIFPRIYSYALELNLNVLQEGLCPDLENWYFAPMRNKDKLWSTDPPNGYERYDLLRQTLNRIKNDNNDDKTSIDYNNNENRDSSDSICLTVHTDYLISCVEMNLAMEYKVINFDFYNDWINGTLYFPRFMRYIRPKKTFLGITFARSKVKGCMDDTSIFSKTRRYTQQCSMGFKPKNIEGKSVYAEIEKPDTRKHRRKIANNLHKQRGLTQKTIFGKNGGICHEHTTTHNQNVYYMKPCEWTEDTIPNAIKVNLFATDIILLGSLNECDMNGISHAFKYLSSTSYIMPTNLALTNMENNGSLYTTSRGVICSGKERLTSEDAYNDSKVNNLDPNKGLTAEILAFSGSLDTNYNVQYDGKELSDIIALTEAAGISWNYTGPGQGDINHSALYYPGGHFLGLSCVHSETNIKSCINLSRICELGSNMSQRKEDISSINEKGEVIYTYTAPTGFISGNDIVGENFRTMFATMNYKRLIATKINPLTGYKMYDFDYLKPINFDGAFKNVINSVDGTYSYNNKKIKILDETTIKGRNGRSVLEEVGIETNSNMRPDFDKNEYLNTQTRTIEDTSLDYYLYRLGLDYNDLSKNGSKQLRKFLINDSNKLYLPQYENSYYFYFGLKNGSTAIDEFNKQFFSQCENGMLLVGEPKINISANDNFNICQGKTDIDIITNNLELPFQSIEIISDVNFENGIKYLLIKNGDEETKYDSWLTNYGFTLKNCEFGTYKVIIRDANDNIINNVEKIGSDILSFNAVAYNFNFDTSIAYSSNFNDDLLFRGGYISVSNIKIEDLDKSQILKVYVKNGVPNQYLTFTNDGNGTPQNLIVPKIGTYELRVKYRCENYTTEVDLLLQSFTIKDNSSLKLMIGVPNTISKELTIDTHPYGWWSATTMSNNTNWVERFSTFNNVLPSLRKEEPSSIKVYADNGIKALWGNPQSNINGIKTDAIWSSENVEGWTDNNYILDDEYLHYPTYKYKGKETTHFSAIVYKDNMVMGKYIGKLFNKNITLLKDFKYKTINNEVCITDTKNNIILKQNCGYVFKPLPDGELQFNIFDGKTLTANTLINGEEITDGVFYPSISYPSMDRPFYAITNFYCWQNRRLNYTPDWKGKSEPTVEDVEEVGRTEVHVFNGLTYNNSFCTKFDDKDEERSVVTNLNELNFKNIKESDMYGLSETTNNKAINRHVYLQGYNENISVEQVSAFDSPYGKSYAYIKGGQRDFSHYESRIIEGAPNKEAAQYVSMFQDNIDSLFDNYVTYTVDENKHIIGPTPHYNNKLVKYHMAKVPNSPDSFIVADKYVYLYVNSDNDKVVFLLCTYTVEARYDDEGAPVIVKLKFNKDKDGKHSKFTAFYPYKNENDQIVTFEKEYKIPKGEREKGLWAAFNYFFRNCSAVKGMTNYKINYNFLKNSKKYDNWADVLKDCEITNKHVYDPSNVYFAYATIEGESGKIDVNNNGLYVPKTTLYKIYPIAVKVTQIKGIDETDITINGLTGETIFNVEQEGCNNVLFILEGSTTEKWVSKANVDWCHITPNQGIRKDEILLTVDKNPENAEREGIIYFYYNTQTENDSVSYITIRQKPNIPESYQYSISEHVSKVVTTKDFEISTDFNITVDDNDKFEINIPKMYTIPKDTKISKITFDIFSKYDPNKESIGTISKTGIFYADKLQETFKIIVNSLSKDTYTLKINGSFESITNEIEIGIINGNYIINRLK